MPSSEHAHAVRGDDRVRSGLLHDGADAQSLRERLLSVADARALTASAGSCTADASAWRVCRVWQRCAARTGGTRRPPPAHVGVRRAPELAHSGTSVRTFQTDCRWRPPPTVKPSAFRTEMAP